MSDDHEPSEHARAFLKAQSQDAQQKKDYAFDPDKFPDISTSKEKKGLEAARETPKFQHPEPDGWTPPSANPANSKDAAEREERIRFLHDRLTQKQENFERDVDQSFDIER